VVQNERDDIFSMHDNMFPHCWIKLGWLGHFVSFFLLYFSLPNKALIGLDLNEIQD
jgi:hypothetical protein